MIKIKIKFDGLTSSVDENVHFWCNRRAGVPAIGEDFFWWREMCRWHLSNRYLRARFSGKFQWERKWYLVEYGWSMRDGSPEAYIAGYWAI